MPGEEDVPLTALCAICHVNTIKYTCPRCSIHTCSLTCVKRHKQYAQCSGIRNPAAYRKRAELATPTSIDQDFNFITKVERTLQRADEDVADRGIHLAPAGLRRYGGPPKTKFETEVQAQNIKLIRAPEGISRRKQNKSTWKGNNISWTIEWLAYTGDRRLQNLPDSRTVFDGFAACFGKKGLSRKRKRDSNESSERREKVNSMGDNLEQKESQNDGNAQQPTPPDDAVQENPRIASNTKRPSEDLYFYLHRPQTSSKLKCLIPLDQSSTWKEVLKGRTLLEHPTIYVREEPPDKLQDPFILECDYLQNHGADVVVPLALQLESTKEADQVPTTLDSNKVLEVLKADLKS